MLAHVVVEEQLCVVVGVGGVQHRNTVCKLRIVKLGADVVQ